LIFKNLMNCLLIITKNRSFKF